ncbi:pyrophosphate-dependent phosphofructokinase [Chitinispirillum alkaliphilum]|nr:pyrophosphate-dependent phosphofructokinase [Chitinispirillum alkaliphilum]
MNRAVSSLQAVRSAYKPKLPEVFAKYGSKVKASTGESTTSISDQDQIKALFPNTYGLPLVTFEAPLESEPAPLKAGVILSGGQAPGGHNVIAGIYDGLKNINDKSELYGFLGGPSGLTDNEYILFTDEKIDEYRNTGGFDIIGSGRTKLETEEQFDQVINNCKKLGITALVVIGGDDSNTNACMLAEYCLKKNSGIQVIGCPKTIDGDLKNQWIETSFGFDTATKVYAELIGNIQRDANSAKKYWHFIKLMGRSASHIALECALKTRPNITLISEEILEKKKTLKEVVVDIAEVVRKRSDAGKNFGVVLIPEGLIEFIPEMKKLIAELNDLLAANEEYFETLPDVDKFQYVNSKLAADTSYAFSSLPRSIQYQLLADRDPHGNVQVSRIETEKLLIDMVENTLSEWKSKGEFKGKFNALNHFFGYEGRCAAPSNFDADYCYSLGYSASALVNAGKSGYLSSVRNLTQPVEKWIAGGIPLTMMMNLERRHGKDKPVIKKALVELDGKPYLTLVENREKWATQDSYLYPGPIQYFGPGEVCDITTETIKLERS